MSSKSASFEALLTSEVYGDRVLGVSRNHTYPTNIMALMSGNNVLLKGNSWRRVLTVRLDAQCADPQLRDFDLNPLEHCRVYRQAIVAASLSILRAFIAAGKPRHASGRTASFEEWDDLIRQCVAWLAEKKIVTDVSDPGVSMQTAKENAPGQQTLALFYNGIDNAYGMGAWKASDVMKRAARDIKGDEELHEALDNIAHEKGCDAGSWRTGQMGGQQGRNLHRAAISPARSAIGQNQSVGDLGAGRETAVLRHTPSTIFGGVFRVFRVFREF